MGYDRGDSFPFDFKSNGVPLVQNRKENCHHDHIPLNLKGIGNIVFSVQKRKGSGTIPVSPPPEVRDDFTHGNGFLFPVILKGI